MFDITFVHNEIDVAVFSCTPLESYLEIKKKIAQAKSLNFDHVFNVIDTGVR